MHQTISSCSPVHALINNYLVVCMAFLMPMLSVFSLTQPFGSLYVGYCSTVDVYLFLAHVLSFSCTLSLLFSLKGGIFYQAFISLSGFVYQRQERLQNSERRFEGHWLWTRSGNSVEDRCSCSPPGEKLHPDKIINSEKNCILTSRCSHAYPGQCAL